MNIHSLVHALTDGGVEFVIIGGGPPFSMAVRAPSWILIAVFPS